MTLGTRCFAVAVLLTVFTPLIVCAQTMSLGFSTLLGGSRDDRAHGMAVDGEGNVYLTSPITSIDFPVSKNAPVSMPTGIYAAGINRSGESLIFSTYIGAPGTANYAHGIAVDDKGFIYIAGNTTSTGFPTTENAFDRTYNGTNNGSHGDAFVVKLTPGGTGVVYSTLIGGSGMDICGKIAVDEDGCAYVLGSTSSGDFPVTAGAFDTTFGGGSGDGRDDLFVAKLNADGSGLLYCTYIGGSRTDMYGNNILTDDTGAVIFAATTVSADFPVTPGAYDASYNGGSGIRGAGDGVIVKLNPAGTALECSTFIGGSGDDFASWVTADASGNLYVCGTTGSADFPSTSVGLRRDGASGGFAAKFDSRLSTLLFSTGWNGSVLAMAVRESGDIVLAGNTEIHNVPVTRNALQTTGNGSGDIFISVLDPDTGTLRYGTYFGGRGYDTVSCVAPYGGNSLYVCGNTSSPDFPVSPGAYDGTYGGGTNQWGGDAFVARFSFGVGAFE